MINGADKRRNGPTLSESEDNELLSEHTSEHECQPSTAANAATSSQQPNGSRFTLNVESHPLSHHDSIISRQSSHQQAALPTASVKNASLPTLSLDTHVVNRSFAFAY
ncbi:hypothetical protein Y032_0007g3387 [Ancylostoma ceylanicum]|uniref:Uncharacterized protein n=1 Tax=Ancylostoma ceylanicum TaxID=53326 RepID=A0A016VPP4_9BILA|nr:hypothetical protein Y032_0007g3387 [Ancylostoma ceylanicum]